MRVVPAASRSVGVEPAAWLGADEGKNYLNSARSSEGDQAGRTADFIDSIDPKRTSSVSFGQARLQQVHEKCSRSSACCRRREIRSRSSELRRSCGNQLLSPPPPGPEPHSLARRGSRRDRAELQWCLACANSPMWRSHLHIDARRSRLDLAPKATIRGGAGLVAWPSRIISTPSLARPEQLRQGAKSLMTSASFGLSSALHQTLSFVSVCRHLFDPLLTRTRRPSPGQLKSFLRPSA